MKCLALKIRLLREDEEKFLSKHLLYIQENHKKVLKSEVENKINLEMENKNIDFLSIKEKTLAKFLDEYNWITFTKKVELPPKWYPNKKS